MRSSDALGGSVSSFSRIYRGAATPAQAQLAALGFSHSRSSLCLIVAYSKTRCPVKLDWRPETGTTKGLFEILLAGGYIDPFWRFQMTRGSLYGNTGRLATSVSQSRMYAATGFSLITGIL